MQITINETTYSATFNFNALDKLMEDAGIEKFSELGTILGQDEDEVSRTTIGNYAKLVLYGIQEHNRINKEEDEPDLADLKPMLITNPDLLEQVANELQKALPQGDEQEGGGAEKKGQNKSQQKNSSKGSSSAS
ncbi:hypothetical protein OSG_eHP30_00205 [environmental Halophage eHP-30]|nr:hypothetical protein OSG_eHP30_00205 [environmental Halophage eHP-30]